MIEKRYAEWSKKDIIREVLRINKRLDINLLKEVNHTYYVNDFIECSGLCKDRYSVALYSINEEYIASLTNKDIINYIERYKKEKEYRKKEKKEIEEFERLRRKRRKEDQEKRKTLKELFPYSKYKSFRNFMSACNKGRVDLKAIMDIRDKELSKSL